MRHRVRPGYGLFQLLVLLAMLAMLIGLLLPAVMKVRMAAARMQSMNNLKQIGLAMHNYCSTYNGKLPKGLDDKNYSALFQMLPFIEQDNLFKAIDQTKDCDDKANAKVRATAIKTFLSPLDAINESAPAGGTNYFAMAGSKMPLKKNDGPFSQDFPFLIGNFPDGTSNTVIFVEMLRGDGGKKAVSVERQHVRFKAADLKTLKLTSGVKEFKADKHIVANRGAAWIDGRFLQATTNATRGMLDEKPDVDCGGEGGLAGVRMPSNTTQVGMADGSVRSISSKLSLATWQYACNASDGMVLGADW